MTAPLNLRKISFNGNGSSTVLYAAGLTFFDATDLSVISTVIATGVETTLTSAVHYTVDVATKNVNILDPATDFPATVKWTVVRTMPLTQLYDYEENDSFPAESHETALDRLTAQNQDQQDEINRSIKLPVSEAAPLAVDVGPKAARASKFLGFDASGDLTVATPASTNVSLSPFALTLVDDANAAAARVTLDAQEDVMTTNGDLVTRAAGVTARIVAVASGKVLASTGVATVPAWTDPLLLSLGIPGYIDGCILTHAAANITVSAGVGRDSTDVLTARLASSMQKTTANPWVADTANGGMPLAAANSTWYHVFLIAKPDGTTDVGFDTAVNAANLLAAAAGYTLFRRIGSALTDGAAQFVAFFQWGDWFYWTTPSFFNNNNVNATTIAIPTPPDVQCMALINAYIEEQAGPTAVVGDIRAIATANYALDAGILTNADTAGVVGNLSTLAFSGSSINQVQVLTNTSSQVELKSNNTSSDIHGSVIGWMDSRGRNW